jgi:sirohydrochlorin ferrochelatase
MTVTTEDRGPRTEEHFVLPSLDIIGGRVVRLSRGDFGAVTVYGSVDEVLDRMAADGIKSILFVGGTGFFDRSSHSLLDIPEAIERQRKRYPDIRMAYAPPDVDLVMPQLARAVMEKLTEALKDGTPVQS